MGQHPDQVIITYIPNYKFHLNNLRKYNQFINRIYSSSQEILSYLEMVENGLVIIYNNFNTFKLLVRPITKDIRKKCEDIAKHEKNFLLEGMESGELFPKEGYLITADSTTNTISELFPFLKAFYESIHQDITVIINKEEKVEILMKSYESYVAYNTILFGITRMFE